MGTENLLLVLIEDAGLRVLEDDVRKLVAARDLALNFGVEVVLGVLGLPVTARQAVRVAQGAAGGAYIAFVARRAVGRGSLHPQTHRILRAAR